MAGVDATSARAVLRELMRRRTDLPTVAWGFQALSRLASSGSPAAAAASVLAANGASVFVAVMNAHPASAFVAHAGCVGLRTVAAASAAGSTSAAAAGASAAIAAALGRHPSSLELALAGVGALCHLPRLPSAQLETQRLATAICGAMRAHPGSELLSVSGCTAICTAIVFTEGLGAHAVIDLADVVVSAMRAHPGSLMTALWGCSALGMLAREECHTQAVIAAGGPAAVVAAMTTFPEDAGVADAGCEDLSFFAAGSNALARAFVDVGGLAVVISALRAHPRDARVALFGCSALEYAVAGTVDDAPLLEAIVAAGGVAATISALRAHPCEAGQSGSQVLTYFSTSDSDAALGEMLRGDGAGALAAAVLANPGKCEIAEASLESIDFLLTFASEESQVRAIAKAAAREVCGALLKHCDSELAAENGASAVQQMTQRCAACVPLIVKQKGVEALIAVATAHAENSEIISDVVGALAGIALPDSAVSRSAAAASIPVIVHAIETHLFHSKIVIWGCSALSDLAAHSSTHSQAIATAGGLAAIITALQSYPGQERITVFGCCALRWLAGSLGEPQKQAIMVAEGHDVLIAAVWTHPTSEEVVEEAFVGLQALAAASEERARAIIRAGGAAVIKSVMLSRDHRGSRRVAALGCSVLYCLAADSDDNRQALVTAGAVASAVAAIRAFPGDMDVAYIGTRLLAEIAAGPAALKAAVVAAGGAAAVAEALRAFPEDRNTALEGNSAIERLSSGPDDLLPDIVTAGGVEVAVRALRSHGLEASTIALSCCQALARLCVSPAAVARAVAAPGGAGAVTIVLQAHGTGYADIAQPGCLILGLLLSAESNRIVPSVDLAGHDVSSRAMQAAKGVAIVTAMLKIHASSDPPSLGVVESASAALDALIIGNDARLMKVFCSYEGVLAAVGALTAHPSSLQVVQRCTSLLMRAVQDADTRTMLACGCVAAVAASMHTHHRDVLLAKTGSGLLLRLCSGAAGAKSVIANGGIQATVAAMTEHAADTILVQRGCSLLLSLLMSAGGGRSAAAAQQKQAVVDAGGVGALVAALQARSSVRGDASVGTLCCKALAQLATPGPPGQAFSFLEALVRDGAPAAVAAAMSATPGVAAVQWWGMEVLGPIIVNGPPAHRQAVILGGGVVAVAAALRTHAACTEFDFALVGCTALLSLASRSATDSSEVQAVVAAEGVPAIVTALRAQVKTTPVAQEGCRALRAIAAASPTHAHAVAAAGGAAAIVSTLRAHRIDFDACVAGCEALAALAAASEALAMAVVSAHGVDAVVSALRAHPCDTVAAAHAPRDTAVVEAGRRMLRAVAQYTDGRSAVAAAKGEAFL